MINLGKRIVRRRATRGLLVFVLSMLAGLRMTACRAARQLRQRRARRRFSREAYTAAVARQGRQRSADEDWADVVAFPGTAELRLVARDNR
jgi:CHASE1-domain containing sensor protein